MLPSPHTSRCSSCNRSARACFCGGTIWRRLMVWIAVLASAALLGLWYRQVLAERERLGWLPSRSDLDARLAAHRPCRTDSSPGAVRLSAAAFAARYSCPVFDSRSPVALDDGDGAHADAHGERDPLHTSIAQDFIHWTAGPPDDGPDCTGAGDPVDDAELGVGDRERARLWDDCARHRSAVATALSAASAAGEADSTVTGRLSRGGVSSRVIARLKSERGASPAAAALSCRPRRTRITQALVQRAWAQSHLHGSHYVRVQIIANRLYAVDVPIKSNVHERLRHIWAELARVLSTVAVPDVDLVLNPWDEPAVRRFDTGGSCPPVPSATGAADAAADGVLPVLSYTKSDEFDDIRMPYVTALDLDSYEPVHTHAGVAQATAGDSTAATTAQEDASLAAAWTRPDRRAVAVWRGSLTGHPRPYDVNWSENVRVRLCDLSRAHPGDVDAAFIEYWHAEQGDPIERDEAIRQVLQQRCPLAPPLPLVSQAERFKYLMDVDGNSWSSRFLRLLSLNAVIIKARGTRTLSLPTANTDAASSAAGGQAVRPGAVEVVEPRTRFEAEMAAVTDPSHSRSHSAHLSEWRDVLTAALTPYVHYWPVAANLSDVVDAVRALRADDARAQRIAQNAAHFALRHLHADAIACFWLRLLREYAARQDFQPTLHPNARLIFG